MAYQADDRQDLLTAINHFLDCSVVLPPSEVGGDELLHSVARFQREMLRKREEQQSGILQEKQTDNQQDEGQPSFDLDHFSLYLIGDTRRRQTQMHCCVRILRLVLKRHPAVDTSLTVICDIDDVASVSKTSYRWLLMS